MICQWCAESSQSAARNDYRFSSLITGIVKSEPFQMRRALEGDQPAVTTAAVESSC